MYAVTLCEHLALKVTPPRPRPTNMLAWFSANPSPGRKQEAVDLYLADEHTTPGSGPHALCPSKAWLRGRHAKKSRGYHIGDGRTR